jgi:hypothetical protein
MHVYIGATKRRRRRTCNNALTSNDGVRAQVRCGGGVVHQVLDDEVAVGVDEGHEGGGIERLVVEVEGVSVQDISVHTPNVRPCSLVTANNHA